MREVGGVEWGSVSKRGGGEGHGFKFMSVVDDGREGADDTCV